VGYLEETKNRDEGVYIGHHDVPQNNTVNGLLPRIIPVTSPSRKGNVRIRKSCHKLVKLAEVINFLIYICLLLDFKCIIICSFDEYVSSSSVVWIGTWGTVRPHTHSEIHMWSWYSKGTGIIAQNCAGNWALTSGWGSSRTCITPLFFLSLFLFSCPRFVPNQEWLLDICRKIIGEQRVKWSYMYNW
jgi:hypothetical protein